MTVYRTIDVTPWGLLRAWPVSSEIHRSDFHCARAVRRLLKVTKSEKCTSDKKSLTVYQRRLRTIKIPRIPEDFARYVFCL